MVRVVVSSVPTSPGSYVLPCLYALLLHCLIVLVLIGLPTQQDSFVVQPRAIKASLVSVDQIRPNKPAQKQKVAASQKRKPEPKIPDKPLEKPAPVIPPLEKTAPPTTDATPAREIPEEDSGIDPSLDEWLDEESAEIQAEEDQEKVAYYATLIREQMHRVWNRPPSARNNMVVVLAIRLLPRGDVVAATIVESSGNAALDRSAVAAVKRVERFRGLSDMESRLFEDNFREFEMRFRPEDLRL